MRAADVHGFGSSWNSGGASSPLDPVDALDGVRSEEVEAGLVLDRR